MTTHTIDIDEAPASGPQRPRRRVVTVVALGAVVAVAVMGGVLISNGPDAPPPPAPTTAPTLAAGEVAPGLTQGTATITWGNTDALYGVPIGWERDVDGAIGAGMNYIAASHSLVNHLSDLRGELVARIYTPSGATTSAITDRMAVARLAAYGANEQGEPVRDGVVTDENMYVEAYPRHGAYKVLDVEQDAEGQPALVTLKTWMPAVAGPGTPDNLDDVKVGWWTEQVDVVWYEGDWRIDAVAADTTQPTPYDGRRTNQPYSNVATLLGPGWQVPADGTDQPYPGSVLSHE